MGIFVGIWLSTLRKAQFGQTLRYFEFLTSSFTRVNSGVKISKSLDFAQIHTFRSRLMVKFFATKIVVEFRW